MITYHQFCQIHDLHGQRGLTPSQIARELTLDPRTVAYWLAQKHFHPRKSSSRASKLDPFKGELVRMLERHPYRAVQVFQRLREQGFAGGYSLVKAYVRTVRPRRQPAFLKLAFAPGECAQVDWGVFGAVPVGQTQRRLSFFVMVLCYSRMMYVEFTVSQTMEHFLACHQHACEYFGAFPTRSWLTTSNRPCSSGLWGRPRCSIPSTWILRTTTASRLSRAMWARAMKKAGWKTASGT
jgi:transposase